MKTFLLLATALFLPGISAPEAAAAELKEKTIQAWNRYVGWTAARVDRELSDPDRFLILDHLPATASAALRRRVANGAIVIEKMEGVVPKGEKFDVPDGEIHHWWGAVLVPDVTLENLLLFLQDYDNHANRFSDVERSRLVSREGNRFRFQFRLTRSKAFFTAHYNTDQEAVYAAHGPRRASSRSVATRIAEIEDAGTPGEKERPPGDDRGFLWRLVSWWRFQQTEKGVLVECESASLSRDIPGVVRLIPLLSGYIRSTPRESLESVLASIRAAAPGHGLTARQAPSQKP